MAKRGRAIVRAELVAGQYPRLCRMAAALTGQEAAARAAVQTVVRHSATAAANWDGPADAARWFMHHGLLTVRRMTPPNKRGRIDLANDPLIRQATNANAYYPLYIQALRAMPVQQREAFLLHHCERMDTRALGGGDGLLGAGGDGAPAGGDGRAGGVRRASVQ